MKICCFSFLCFGGESDEDNCDKTRSVYTLLSHTGDEGVLVIQTEEMADDGMESGFRGTVETAGEVEELALQSPAEAGNNSQGLCVAGEGSRDFLTSVDDAVARWPSPTGASGCPGVRLDVDLNLGLGVEPSPTSSSSVSTTVDGQNKRLRMHSSLSLSWSTHTENEIISPDPVPERIEDEHFPYSSASGSDVINNCDAIETDNFSVDRMDLTDDLLHMVFSFLDQIDLCSAAMVCRQWRDGSSHEDFWRYLNFENRHISERQFRNMCRRYPNAVAVNVYGTPNIHPLAMKAISLLRKLEALTLGKYLVRENFFEVLTNCHTLRSLTINDGTLGNGIQEITIDHNVLRNLHIVKCRVLRVSIRCPQLETLSLKRSSMLHAVLNCPLLRELDIASCHKLSDAAIRTAASSCPLLESLDISNCSCVSDETLREITMSCGNLHVLDGSYCPNISLESVVMPMLTVLKLHSCEGITSASMAAISHSYMLEVLELDNCSLLTSVSLDLPRLRKISLVHCRKFVDLHLRSSVLSSITVSNCPSLQRIDIASDALKKLVLQKQESLNLLSLECNFLEELDLTECESLTNSVCEVFSRSGGCPVLRTLVLDSCESLTEVSFSSTSLVSLSIGGCCSITSLDLSCPNLNHISLDGCDHLERAKFSPVGLVSLNLGICPKLNALHLEAPKMVSLILEGCGVLSKAIIDCPLLASLDASFCSQLKDDCLSATTLSCPLIQSLVLMSCHSVGGDGLSSLCSLQGLAYLDLSYTFVSNLQPVFDSCLYLKVLKLQACKYLSDTSLEPLYKGNALLSLCELDLSYGILSQLAIEELLTCCGNLTHINLTGCASMQDLDLGSRIERLSLMGTFYGPSPENEGWANRLLQTLNCVGCPNIKKVVIPTTARCFHLSLLNLSLSSNLREVDLSCCGLTVLNLSNCYSLEILKLDCPRLTSLSLQYCNISDEAVEAAIRDCNMLETLDLRFCPKISPLSMVTLRTTCSSLRRIFNSLVPPT